MLAAGIALAGCASAGHEAGRPSGGTASAEVSQLASTPHATVQLIWHHAGDSGPKQEWYVARIVNPTGQQISMTLKVTALDTSDAVVGSSEEALPAIPARAHFDYFGQLGDAFKELSGTPAKIEISQAPAAAAAIPMLKTSEVKLTAQGPDQVPQAPRSTGSVTAAIRAVSCGYGSPRTRTDQS